MTRRLNVDLFANDCTIITARQHLLTADFDEMLQRGVGQGGGRGNVVVVEKGLLDGEGNKRKHRLAAGQ